MKEQALLDEIRAAQQIGMSVAFLRRGRQQGIVGGRTPAPPHLKIGRAVRYLQTDLDTWLLARRIDPVLRKASVTKPRS
jgi:hypothetical protein